MSYEQRALSTRERLDWLRLIRSEHIGPASFRNLLSTYGSAEAALTALPERCRKVGARPIRLFSYEAAEQELTAAEKIGARALTACEPDYPPLLSALQDPPPLIYARGSIELLHRPAVAVVGARNASANGRVLAASLAGDLARSGLAVVSGLARGIDTAAHEAALAGGTIAVMAGGVDTVYPAENESLYQAIVEHGAVISERPPATAPKARDFPRRNRLISGLSYGVVVVEAALRSGSLITARLAAEQGREVFAVPGSPLDPRAAGTNSLLRQGASLVEGAQEVIDVITPMLDRAGQAEKELPERRPLATDRAQVEATATAPADASRETDRQLVSRLLGPVPIDIDELIRQARLTPERLMPILLEMELAGRIHLHAGNKVSIS
jgi:DNA processing protein